MRAIFLNEFDAMADLVSAEGGCGSRSLGANRGRHGRRTVRGLMNSAAWSNRRVR